MKSASALSFMEPRKSRNTISKISEGLNELEVFQNPSLMSSKSEVAKLELTKLGLVENSVIKIWK